LTADPADYVAIVGRTFVAYGQRPLLTIGKLSWTRYALGRLGCPHPHAAVTLQRVVTELRITSLAQLAAHAAEIGQFKGVGVTAYWVVLAILRDAGYDVQRVHPEPVTFHTLKQRARRVEARQPKRRRRRAGPPSQAA
jgi:hypothetical protein